MARRFILFLLILSIYFVSADCEEGQIDINTASIEDLDLIKWVGEATAQAIIDSRPFSCLDDLINVSGIGETKLQDIKDQGLACVDNANNESEDDHEEQENEENDREDKENEESEDENEEDSDESEGKIISYSIVNKKAVENKTPEKIILNPKDINTENLTKELTSNYALLGLGIFSIVIIILLTLKFRRLNKNEFRE
jgi:ABC-type Zn2+ transport system substrate-binding protein/surface adhesin